MKYTIGEFASILGVTTDTLRLYEKYGIIKPKKNNENNYRYFNDLDARSLLMSRWYRSFDISLQDTASLTKDANAETILDKMNEKQQLLKEEIIRKQLLLSKMEQIEKEIKDITLRLNNCKIKQLPGIFRLKQTNRNDLLKDDYLRELSNTWMELLPFTFFSFQMNYKELITNEKHLSYNWGLAIFEDEIHNFGIHINDYIDYIPPKTYLSSVILTNKEEYLTKELLHVMIDSIKENGYQIKGDIVGKILVNEKINDFVNHYIEVNIPI